MLILVIDSLPLLVLGDDALPIIEYPNELSDREIATGR
jgi:hypothetical protein